MFSTKPPTSYSLFAGGSLQQPSVYLPKNPPGAGGLRVVRGAGFRPSTVVNPKGNSLTPRGDGWLFDVDGLAPTISPSPGPLKMELGARG